VLQLQKESYRLSSGLQWTDHTSKKIPLFLICRNASLEQHEDWLHFLNDSSPTVTLEECFKDTKDFLISLGQASENEILIDRTKEKQSQQAQGGDNSDSDSQFKKKLKELAEF
jgi:hypothetical protein